jgi:nitroreductase
MSTPIYRRGFVKQGMALGGALLLRPGGSAEARALGDGEPTNPTLATLHDLHTTHGNFTERDVPEEQVEQILQASFRAANASNMQTYSVVLVSDRARMKQVCGYQGSRLLVYCVDYNRLEAGAASLGHAYSPGDITDLVTGSINAAIAAQTAVVAARSLGVDSLLTNGIHRGDMTRLWTLLDLPERHCFPLIALVLGYASQPPEHRTGRLTDLGVVHRERYHRLTEAEVAEITARYDDPEDHLGLNPDWASQGHKHYLDWLFTVWLGRRSQPATADTGMDGFLRRAGFIEP